MTVPHSSRFAGLKDYISQREFKLSLPSRRTVKPGEDGEASSTPMSWGQWAGQRIRRHTQDIATIDEVHLFPGWAMKRPRRPKQDEHESAFDVVFHVSGWATSRRTPELMTRSQRAFLKLARSFASLPKPQPIMRSSDTELGYSPERLRLPPLPDEIPDDYEVANLDAQFRNSGTYHTSEMNELQSTGSTNFTPQILRSNSIPTDSAHLTDNLESRLKLFWSSSLSSRRVLVSIFLRSLDPQNHRRSQERRPLLTQELWTGSDGFFSGTFRIDWKEVCTHPIGVRLAFDQAHGEYELIVEAQVAKPDRVPELHETPTHILHIPITDSTLRVISDIDDTVKVSRVVDGARAIFHQVFVKDLEDTTIPEMGEWYDRMWKRGVRFHYVSNGPFELLPVINTFITISKLPLGSIRLRSYAGRSLFNGLLSAPSTRKRANVEEVLDHFPDSIFLLIGDSGEQDLELYASLAAERPGQIAGVFIRDVSVVDLDNPTGVRAGFMLTNSPRALGTRATLPFPSSTSPPRPIPQRAVSDTEVSPTFPGAMRIPRPRKQGSLPPQSYSSEQSSESKPLSRLYEDESSSVRSVASSISSSLLSARLARPITEGEKKRWELQNRVNKARLMMPSHIVLRVFQDPKECMEAEQIIERLMSTSQTL